MKSQSKPISILLLCIALGFISCDKEKKDDKKTLLMLMFLNAPRVYGQTANFTSRDENKGGVTPNSLHGPYGVAADAGGIYITDSGNNRVLYYAGTSTTATRVFGQSGSFATGVSNNGGVSENSLNIPHGIAVDAGGVYIADRTNNRVLYYPGTSTTATRVYGQSGSFVTNAANNGGVSKNSLSGPRGVAVDASGVYIVDYWNHRVLYYPGASTTATRVYGQGGNLTTALENNGGLSADSLKHPSGVAVDTGGVYIADSENSRVLYYAGTSTTAIRVYGQPDFVTRSVNTGGISASSINCPSDIFVAAGGIYISDNNNNRVLYYPGTSTTATAVYGQQDFISNTANNGGVSGHSLFYPYGVALGGGRLFIADYSNNRVIMY